MKEFIALYKNGKYKLLETESDVFKKRDKIQFLLIPTSTALKGTTYTLIEGDDIRRVREEDIKITTVTSTELNQYDSIQSNYSFKIKDLISAFNIYPFFKIFSEISIFTSQHPGCINILSYATIHEYPGSTNYPYKLDRDKFKLGYHDMLMKFIFDDGHWRILGAYEEVPDNFTAIYIFNTDAHDGYLFTNSVYHQIVGSKLYLEVTQLENREYPTEGETLLSLEIEDNILGFNKVHSAFTLDMIEVLLVAPQIIMYLTEIMKEELYLLIIWNDITINKFIKPGEPPVHYSIYNLLFNN